VKFERVYPVHRCLSDRRTGITADELLEKLRDRGDLGWSKTTLQRTLKFLHNVLGAPLDHDKATGRYRYEKGSRYELPGVWFSGQELAALLVLGEVLQRQPLGLLSETLRPIQRRLDERRQSTQVGMPEWHQRLRLLRMAARPPGERFAAVADALAHRRRLRIEYHARGDDLFSRRVVSPQRLTLYRENWYLDAWCHTRKGIRTFALDRIADAEALSKPAQRPPAPSGPDR
jgi:predicted DNA-binding transcriptional regulator YafY